LYGKLDFEQHISETTHIRNTLRFSVKTWCQSHLYGCYWRNTMIEPNVSSPGSLNIIPVL